MRDSADSDDCGVPRRGHSGGRGSPGRSGVELRVHPLGGDRLSAEAAAVRDRPVDLALPGTATF